MPRLERKDETDFIKYAAKRKCLSYKFEIEGRRGAPDQIILCPNGRTLFIEFKREKLGTLSKQQINFHKILINQGFTVRVCFGLQAACDALDEFLNDDL